MGSGWYLDIGPAGPLAGGATATLLQASMRVSPARTATGTTWLRAVTCTSVSGVSIFCVFSGSLARAGPGWPDRPAALRSVTIFPSLASSIERTSPVLDGSILSW